MVKCLILSININRKVILFGSDTTKYNSRFLLCGIKCYIEGKKLVYIVVQNLTQYIDVKGLKKGIRQTGTSVALGSEVFCILLYFSKVKC